MRTMFIFCGALAAVAFVVAFVGSFVSGLSRSLNSASTLAEAILTAAMMGCMASGMTFLAAFMLSISDRFATARAHRMARDRFLAGDDWTEESFCRALPEINPAILRPLREATARFFAIPLGKVQPTAKFYEDDEAEKRFPALQFFVLSFVLKSLGIDEQRLVGVDAKKCADPAGLATKIQRLIDRKDDSDNNANDRK